MNGEPRQSPTGRELEILKILWDRGEATVREVYHHMSRNSPVAQNTVQSFLRTMEEKGLVLHRVQGRTFYYEPLVRRDQTAQGLVSRLLERVFDGAMDQLVQSALALRQPTPEEIGRVDALIAEARAAHKHQRPTP